MVRRRRIPHEDAEVGGIPADLLVGSDLQIRNPELWMERRMDWARGMSRDDFLRLGLTPVGFIMTTCRGGGLGKVVVGRG